MTFGDPADLAFPQGAGPGEPPSSRDPRRGRDG